MKRLAFLVAISATAISMHGCNEVDNDGKTRIIQDSITTILPTWQALRINVSKDNTDMHIIVGDSKLYKAGDDVKKQKTADVAAMVLRIYGKGNYLEKGTLTVTADVNNKVDTPADGINIPIDFEAMKKAQGN